MRSGRAIRPDRVTVQQARTQLKMMLAGCTDVALGRMTVGGLASTHNLPAKEIEYELLIEQQRRAR